MSDHYNFNPNNGHNSSPASRPVPSGHERHLRLVAPLISLYQDGEASPAEQVIVEQYLAACAECRAVLESYRYLEAGLQGYLSGLPEPTLQPQDYSFWPPEQPVSEVWPVPATLLAGARPSTGSGHYRRHPSAASGPLAWRGFQTAFTLAVAALVIVAGVSIYIAITGQTGSGQPAPATQPVGQILPPLPLTPEATPEPSPLPPTPAAAPSTPASATEGNTIPLPNLATPAGAALTTPAALAAPTVRPPTARAATATASQSSGSTRLPTSTPVPSTAAATSTPLAPATATLIAPPPTVASPTPAPILTSAATTEPAPTLTMLPAVTAAPETTLAATATPVPLVLPPTPTPVVTTAPTAVPTVIAPAPSATAGVVPPSGFASPVPGWIAYVDRTDEQIHLIRSDGSDDQVIGDPAASKEITWEQLVWSRNGRWLAAVGLNSVRYERAIYLLDVQNPRKLEFITEGIAPVWSPDNGALAYLAGPVSLRSGVKYGRPATINLKRRTPAIISGPVESYPPQWFDGSDRLLVGQDRVFNLASGQASPFKVFINDCVGDSLSPDGNKLAVLEQQPDGRFAAVIYDLNSGTLDPKAPLLRAAPVAGKVGLVCNSHRLRWTADSRNVYYYTNTGSGYSNCVVSLGNPATRCLSNVYEPSFNATGTYLVDFSPAAGLVYVAPGSAAGRPSNVRYITEALFAPVWQPLS